MFKYGQFCPVSKAAEVLGERWTLLVMRELLCGSQRFADLQRGLGRISPSVLSQRLKLLSDAGLIEKTRAGSGYEYRPTPCGQELLPVVQALGVWGQRWVRSQMSKDELDVDLLMLDLQRRIRVELLPGDAVLQIEFTDQRGGLRRWWLLVDEGALDLCTQHPGRPATVTIKTRLRTLSEIWMGDVPLKHALADGRLELSGPKELAADPLAWLQLSELAPVPRAHVA